MAKEAPRRRGRPKGAPPAPERRAQLLAAALTVIRRVGPHVAMDAIAAEAGVTKPVLYAHFTDKAGLSAAVADVVGNQLADEVATCFVPDLSPILQVRGAIEVFIRWVGDEPELFEFLTNAPSSGDAKPEVLAITDRVAEEVTPAIRALFAATGRALEPADVYAHGIVGFVYLAVERWKATDGSDLAALIDSLTGFVWAGLTGPERPVR